jgi:hypothetical protein
MNAEANGLTIRATFGNIPCIDNDLFEVRAGIDADMAITRAACLADSIATIASEAVGNGAGMDPSTTYLVGFAAEVIQGLMHSVEGVYSRKEAQS